MPVEIVPFQQSHIEEAGTLLAHRHQHARMTFPELPQRFADAQVAGRAIAAALRREGAGGAAAIRGGRLCGYLIGDLQFEGVWGRSAWVRSAGMALAPAESTDLLHDLYAFLGEEWVTVYGCCTHFVLAPIANPELVEAWFLLGFGVEQVHALLPLEPDALPSLPDLPGVEIRQAEPEDGERLASMSDVIWRHQVSAPVWGIMLPERVEQTREGWRGLVREEDAVVFVAISEGDLIAAQAYYPAEPSEDNLVIPDHCIHFSVGGTRTEARGRGIQQALSATALHWMRRHGYRVCETDWRSANRSARTAWARHGYRPVLYRMARRIDPRITWARGL